MQLPANYFPNTLSFQHASPREQGGTCISTTFHLLRTSLYALSRLNRSLRRSPRSRGLELFSVPPCLS